MATMAAIMVEAAAGMLEEAAGSTRKAEDHI